MRATRSSPTIRPSTVTPRTTALLVGALLTLAAPAAAQTRTYMEVGGFGVKGGSVTPLVGFRVESATALRPGISVAADLTPFSLIHGVAAGTADIGIAYPVPLGEDVDLVPRAGVGALGGLAPGGFGGLPGLSAGVGLVFEDARLDYTWRRLTFDGDGPVVHSLSVGFRLGGVPSPIDRDRR